MTDCGRPWLLLLLPALALQALDLLDHRQAHERRQRQAQAAGRFLHLRDPLGGSAELDVIADMLGADRLSTACGHGAPRVGIASGRTPLIVARGAADARRLASSPGAGRI